MDPLNRERNEPSAGELPGVSRLFVVFACLAVMTTYLILFQDEHIALELLEEDAIVEAYGAGAFFLAAILFLLAFARSSGFGHSVGSIHTERNYVYLLFAGLFLVAGAEEISWGQRVFGWATPELIGSINRQAETTFHNLAPFHGNEKVISISRMYSLFWLGFCVGLPLLNRIPTFRTRLRRLGIPVTHLWLGGLMLVSYATFKMLAITLEYGELRSGLNELKESNSAMVFALIALFEVRRVSGAAGRRTARTLSTDLPIRR